ncbi:anaphase-promoting complex subunit 11 RING-H2 finger-domain-containing protein [Lactarius sanguifluus]|nr:anaphase-promoting complex subunit 11 RING-H2 finger-domain-containing protein [Lactarius sanguifluus]
MKKYKRWLVFGPTLPCGLPPNNQQLRLTMKITVKRWHAIAQWQWDTGKTDDNGDAEEDVCGICRIPFEGCCPTCKVPGDDCPLIWGECSHVFHMHCLLKWIGTAASKQQCPMDRRPWVTAERKVGVSNSPPPLPVP